MLPFKDDAERYTLTSSLFAMPEAVRMHPQDDALVRTRRRQIFLAACRVLSNKSFHEASVKELALEAGLADGRPARTI